ncbi:endonuclease III [Candidatus Woesearchaeota archaeon]|jgi:endonuclease III|nr:endonuclease III [Candidatus Woesearchaeota archaeon]MBT4387461.1 endonuclease III [Candidatus Woesearchaeota archaeon]MBT4595838.1 endonuclease III [Candidatus Woesearchaeota archaeon]MBT5741313.1 endonuclease III [Candidatus Woesearchaeota archaeon]MBT7297111.1 endonuclease III [Candidatus Woesearchaeota archaeon]
MKYNKKVFLKEFIIRLKKQYPNTKCSLNYSNDYELLFATILSAQCTDERVNKVTEKLFKKYTSIIDFANVPIQELEIDIKSTGFFRSKAKSIKESAIKILEDFDGKVPNKMEELLKLRGVARKTANVVLGVYYNIAAGIVVDTHVSRISYRTGLTKNKNIPKIELDLCKIVPKNNWIIFSHLLIDFGREFCSAPNPKCNNCFVNDICPKKLDWR